MGADLAGGIVDLAIALTLLEMAGLAAYHRLTGRGPAVEAWLPNVTAGLCLMLGLRAAIAGAPWPWVGLALSFAGVAHLVDLRRRWPRREAAGGRSAVAPAAGGAPAP